MFGSLLSPISEKSERFFLFILSSLIIFLLGIQFLTHKALNGEGTEVLYVILLTRSFYLSETARIVLHVLYEFPLVLWAKIGLPLNMDMASYLLSFGFYWGHIFSLAICYFILPKDKKCLFMFPLIQWIFGISLSITRPATELTFFVIYFWAILFIIYFANLEKPLMRILLLIMSLLLFLSHEYIGVLGWILVAISLFTSRKYNKNVSVLLKSLTVWYILCALIGMYYFINPDYLHHRESFLRSVFLFNFLFNTKIMPFALLSILCILGTFFIALFKKSKIKRPITYLGCFMPILVAIYIFLKFWNYEKLLYLENAYTGRVWVALSVPFVLISFFLMKDSKLPRLLFISTTVSAFVIIIGYSLSSIYFNNYLVQLKNKLLVCGGYVDLSYEYELEFQPKELKKFWDDFFAFQISVTYNPDFNVRTIFTNSDNIVQRGILSRFNFNRDYYYYDFSKYNYIVRHGKSGCLK